MRTRPPLDHETSRPRRLAVGAAATAAALGLGVLTAPAAHAAPIAVQILATNDFHGRILDNETNGEAGAAVLAGAVAQLRAENPYTVFAAAGDLIGASTFESFIQSDKPTIDALNAAGLEVSAVGNHELDQGYEDLVDRVLAPYDAEDNPYGGAEWEYIAANLKMRATGDPAVPATWVKTFGDVEVGFVGAVTEDLPTLVSPDGIADIQVTGIVESVNAEAARLVDDGADLVVMLVHEGAATTDCAQGTAPGTRWGAIVDGISPNVDAIVSGHTHLAYNCAYPVQSWIDEGRAVTTRPVVSAGQYGMNLNQLVFTVDGATGEVSALTQSILPLEDASFVPRYPADEAVAEIAAAAKAEADVLGAEELGTIAGPFNRAQALNAAGARIENRGGESTLGNLVAEVQRWATEQPESGGAQIAFMNPGGLRADMVGTDPGDGSFPRPLTYKQAAGVQPFANTLVNMRLTGAQIKTVLEQQWQRDALNALPTRPFLRLGVSDGFTYTYTQKIVTETRLDDPATPNVDESLTPYQAPKGTITGMWLNGTPIDLAASYSVTVNSFLAAGGDNFRELAAGTDKRDTGKIDLSAMVDYMAAFGSSTALPVDSAQRAVEVTFPEDAPATYEPGGTVAFAVRSWSMTTEADAKDTAVDVTLDGKKLGSFPLDNTIGTALYDDYGTAAVSVRLPAKLAQGTAQLVLTGATTGTTVSVPITVAQKVASATIAWPNKLLAKKGAPVGYTVLVTAKGVIPTGTVTVYDGKTAIATATLTATDRGVATFTLSSLGRGLHALSATYGGDAKVAASTSIKLPVLIL